MARGGRSGGDRRGKGVALGAAALLVAAGAAYRARRRRRGTGLSGSFAGRTVLITGGSRGLGFCLAEVFAREGAQVVLCAREQRELEAAQQALESEGARVLAVVCDVTDRGAVASMVEIVNERFGPIDVLVNNAGIIGVGPVEVQTIEDFRKAMDTNFWGGLHCIQAALPQMLERGRGTIVNICSIGGKVAVPHLLPYTASKFALTGLSEGLRAELLDKGISVTTVCPGLMRTGSHFNAYFKGRHSKEFTWFALGDTLPGVSMEARRAARSIVEAAREGRAELILTPQARAVALLHGIAPGATSTLMGGINRLLPSAEGADRSVQSGWQSRNWFTRLPLTFFGRLAARRYNQLKRNQGYAVEHHEASNVPAA